jgi:hypothetical protein
MTTSMMQDPQKQDEDKRKKKAARKLQNQARSKIATKIQSKVDREARSMAQRKIESTIKSTLSAHARQPTVALPELIKPRSFSGWDVPGAPPALTTAMPTLLSVSPALASILRNDEGLMAQANDMLDASVVFTVAARTRLGQKLQESRRQPAGGSRAGLRLSDESIANLPDRLIREGVRVLRVNRYSITVEAPARLVSELIGQPLQLSARAWTRRTSRALGAFDEPASRVQPSQLFFTPPHSLSVVPRLQDRLIDHFVFVPPPVEFAGPSSRPPRPGYHHLTAASMRRLLKVSPKAGDGDGETVCLVDSGFWSEHPHFARSRVRGIHVPGGALVGEDLSGHGTAISRNVLMVAPRVNLVGISYSPGANASGTLIESALEIAGEQNPCVISCSWGWEHEQNYPGIENVLRDLVEDGHIVVFAAGNGTMRAWPASMPEVISVGGVYADEHDALQASNYASGFRSDRYQGRLVPDVCGLCGQQPSGVYIPLPCPPGSRADLELDGAFPQGDETAPGDGWCVMSGTSSAAPQVAGVIALMSAQARSQGRGLTAERARLLLQQSALAIAEGTNAFGLPSTGIPNVATGHGLVQAAAAVSLV